VTGGSAVFGVSGCRVQGMYDITVVPGPKGVGGGGGGGAFWTVG